MIELFQLSSSLRVLPFEDSVVIYAEMGRGSKSGACNAQSAMPCWCDCCRCICLYILLDLQMHSLS